METAGKRKTEDGFKPIAPNEAWSMDYVMDKLQDGSRFSVLTILDVYTREAVAIEAGQSSEGVDVVRTLNRLQQDRGAPKVLFCDHCIEFTSRAMALWAARHGMEINYPRLGKPARLSDVERFNRTFCKCLDPHSCMDLKEAKRRIEAWRQEYNEGLSH
jgi:putative transposase